MTQTPRPTASFVLSVKAKGRTVLPAGLRDACGFGTGTTLRARPIGAGSFVVESQDAILARLRDGRPRDEVTEGVDDLIRWRQETEAARHTRLMEEPVVDETMLDTREAELLARIGS